MGLTATHKAKIERQREERLYEEKYMHCGLLAKIIEYINQENVTIQFEDGVIVLNKTYRNFKNVSIGYPNIQKGTYNTKKKKSA